MGQIDFYAYLDEDSEGSEETEETTLPLPVKFNLIKLTLALPLS